MSYNTVMSNSTETTSAADATNLQIELKDNCEVCETYKTC